jgi:hypothetical protein
MLALRYGTQRGDRVLWPNQYTWLLQQGLIEWKDHDVCGLSGEICDKSNAGVAAKPVAVCQARWFVAQSIMRIAHQLPISQLELMTLSYNPLFLATYFFWWDLGYCPLRLCEGFRQTGTLAHSKSFSSSHLLILQLAWSNWRILQGMSVLYDPAASNQPRATQLRRIRHVLQQGGNSPGRSQRIIHMQHPGHCCDRPPCTRGAHIDDEAFSQRQHWEGEA